MKTNHEIPQKILKITIDVLDPYTMVDENGRKKQYESLEDLISDVEEIRQKVSSIVDTLLCLRKENPDSEYFVEIYDIYYEWEKRLSQLITDLSDQISI